MISLKNPQLKTLSRRALLEFILMGFAFSLALIFFVIPINLTQNNPAGLVQNAVVPPKKEQTSFGLPVRLEIPKINVDTVLEHVGLTPEGRVGVPKGPTGAAWYNLGPHPGNKGSAVISGHYGYWLNGKVGVFTNLYKLRKGDKLYVEDEKGVTATFVVREFRTYDPKATVSDIFVSNDGKAHLNLITCDGIWNKILKSYPKRLVVFTDKEE